MQLIADAVNSATDDVVEKYHKFINPTQVALLKIGGFDHIEHTASGTKITDYDGNEYIDCLGGYGVFSLGHRHPKVVEAVKNQLDLMPLSSKTFLEQAARRSFRTAGGDYARRELQYSFVSATPAQRPLRGRLRSRGWRRAVTSIVACHGGFHGKTMGALSATGRDAYRTPFGPLLPHVAHVPFERSRCRLPLRQSARKRLPIIVEPIQGEGGIKVPSDDYLPGLRQIVRP